MPSPTQSFCSKLHPIINSRILVSPLVVLAMLLPTLLPENWDVVRSSGQVRAESPPDSTPSSTPLKFELDIQPILTARGCNSGPCHGKSGGQNGFALSLLGFDSNFDYDSIVNMGRGRRIFASSPENSLLLLKGAGVLPHGGGIRISPGSQEYQTLQRWITEGAARCNEQDPKLVRIAITPEQHSIASNSTEQLTVTAYFSDGSSRVVTNTCAFQSNEPAIVSVSPDGLLKSSQLPGEATIMARYMGVIATWNTAIPRAEWIESSQYQSLPVRNPIDSFVWKKLETLRMLPSDSIPESKLLRRAYLDSIGRFPSPEEARTYLNDPAPDKYERLLDTLFERPEYADYWANKWADLLRPNPYRVGIKATMSLDQWLRDSFRRNLSYDQFVRELLTAQGSTFRNGATTFFRDRRSPDEVTTMVSQLFLGVRLECAKCHQHPFEVYGQKDFYSLAAYFGRVGYKGTGLSPPISGSEEMVLVKDKGEVRHPLTAEVLLPTPLFGTPQDIPEGEDPRVALVDWMVSPENPTFAQVAVNRLWGELFGIGIVDPVDDLRATNPPSNPELIQFLAHEFRTAKFDQKALLKMIMQSQVYRTSSIPNATNSADNRNFSRHYRQRLRAEVLSDAIADITQVPDRFEGMPLGSRSMQWWTHRGESDFLDAFGRPDPNQDPPCERLPDSTVVQALHLMNAPQWNNKLRSDTGRVAKLAKSTMSDQEIIDELYLAVYSRFPTQEESAALISEFAKPDVQRRSLIEDLLWSLINSPEFVYKD